MEDAYLVEQDNSYPAGFPLADLCTKLFEQCFDILPLDIRTCRVRKNQLERSLMLSLHISMVP